MVRVPLPVFIGVSTYLLVHKGLNIFIEKTKRSKKKNKTEEKNKTRNKQNMDTQEKNLKIDNIPNPFSNGRSSLLHEELDLAIESKDK